MREMESSPLNYPKVCRVAGYQWPVQANRRWEAIRLRKSRDPGSDGQAALGAAVSSPFPGCLGGAVMASSISKKAAWSLFAKRKAVGLSEVFEPASA